ncbi:hypothetical protein, partial [Methylobacterium sp. WL8]|uniref:hypothetical protein n=1 Tax=Methylobacterium sp. WL8 TaxID=2603899 RepID=UPI001AEEBDB0
STRMKGATIVRPGRATLNQRRALVSIRKPRSCHPSRASGFVHPPNLVVGCRILDGLEADIPMVPIEL